MAKTKQEKEQLLSKLGYILTEAKGAVFVDYQGLTVKATESLRGKLADEQSNLLIAKNTLLKRALSEAKLEVPAEVLAHPLAIVYSPQDEVTPAKASVMFAKENEVFEILGGILNGRYLALDQVKNLASLPSLPELQAQFVGTMAAPMSQLVGVLSNATSSIVNVLSAYQRKLEEA